MPFECVIERSMVPASTRPAQTAVRPLSETPGLGLPAISISRQVKGTPKPSALPTASFPAKRAAKCWAGFAREKQYARSASVKTRSTKLAWRSSARATRSISMRSIPTRILAILCRRPAGRRPDRIGCGGMSQDSLGTQMTLRRTAKWPP